jgi:hypothetical protein
MWLAVDEPEAAALDECAWAQAEGRGLLVGVRAGSLEQALQRARAAGAAADVAAPTIAYTLAVVLGADSPAASDDRDAARGSFQVARIVELRAGEPGPNVHEIFGPGRRGELIPVAVPGVLTELARRGVHIAADLFTRT